jgi:hypothetical protein
VRRQLRLLTPYLRGDDVAAVQRALGGLIVDGIYGPLTAARVKQWKWATGYPSNRINAILGPEGQALLFGESEPPREFAARAELRRTRIVRPLETELDPRSEFAIPNRHGAPAASGVRYHAAKDWFAPPGTLVRAPVTGTVVEARSDPRTAGPVFGGTVTIEDRLGRVWVFRHVDRARRRGGGCGPARPSRRSHAGRAARPTPMSRSGRRSRAATATRTCSTR